MESVYWNARLEMKKTITARAHSLWLEEQEILVRQGKPMSQPFVRRRDIMKSQLRAYKRDYHKAHLDGLKERLNPKLVYMQGSSNSRILVSRKRRPEQSAEDLKDSLNVDDHSIDLGFFTEVKQPPQVIDLLNAFIDLITSPSPVRFERPSQDEVYNMPIRHKLNLTQTEIGVYASEAEMLKYKLRGDDLFQLALGRKVRGITSKDLKTFSK
jgi:hypothetical protein